MNPCTICDEVDAKACARCHSARYCSPECQQTDWPSHRLLCSQYSTHTGRPDLSYKRAILFPTNEVKPRLIWVECRTEYEDEAPDSIYEYSRVREYLGGEMGQYDAFPERKPIQRNLLRDRNLANSLEVVCRETFGIDGSEVNKSIVKATHGAVAFPWRGPIIALKKRGLSMDPRSHLDIDMQDYRDVVDYFISYGNELVQDGELGPRDMKGKVRGVKINCKGDQWTFGAEEFSAVDVPRGHPVFYNPVAPISNLVGMPLRTRKCPPDRLWKDNYDDDSYENVPATVLHRNTDDNSGSWWGWAPLEWQSEVGSVLVVRSDDLDVTTQEVEILCRFCQFKMQPLFENATGDGLVPMTREEVMGFLTPESFAEYAAEVRARGMGDNEEMWRSAGERVRGP